MDAWYIDENGRKRRWTAADEAAYQRDLASRKLETKVDARRVTPQTSDKPVKPRAFVIGVRG